MSSGGSSFVTSMSSRQDVAHGVRVPVRLSRCTGPSRVGARLLRPCPATPSRAAGMRRCWRHRAAARWLEASCRADLSNHLLPDRGISLRPCLVQMGQHQLAALDLVVVTAGAILGHQRAVRSTWSHASPRSGRKPNRRCPRQHGDQTHAFVICNTIRGALSECGDGSAAALPDRHGAPDFTSAPTARQVEATKIGSGGPDSASAGRRSSLHAAAQHEAGPVEVERASQRAMTTVATALPIRLVMARASDMNRSTPTSSASPATGIAGIAVSVAASVMNPPPVTAAAPFDVSDQHASIDSVSPTEGARR